MKKIVVTGGAGFIASHIIEEAFARNLEVVILDNMHTGKQSNLDFLKSKGEFRFIRLSFYSSFFLFEYYTGDWTDGLFFYSQVTTQSRLRCLQHVSLLKSLSDDQRTTLVQLLQPRQYTEGEVVFNQGDAGDKFYIVETGNVAIHRRVYFDSRMGK